MEFCLRAKKSKNERKISNNRAEINTSLINDNLQQNNSIKK